jgi:hypothetical protein
MVKCPTCCNEVSKRRNSKENSGFYLVTYRCGICGTKFRLEEWID